MKYKLEIIGFNIGSCITAQQAGAHRIELCDNYAEGGTTPSYAFIKAAREKLSIDLYVMIRPRGGDFLYNPDEFNIMKEDVLQCKNLGCDGIVMGILKSSGEIDRERCSEIIEYAYPLGVTFHRAFDRVKDALQSLEDIIDIGCERILTSGLQKKATEGSLLIKELINKADDKIIIMPGSGVNAENIISLANDTGAVEFHSSASNLKNSEMQFVNSFMDEKLQSITVNKDEVYKMSSLLQSLIN